MRWFANICSVIKLICDYNKFHFLFILIQKDTITNLSINTRGYLTFDLIRSETDVSKNDILFYLREIKVAGSAKDILDFWMKDQYWEAVFGALVGSDSLEDSTDTLSLPFLKTDNDWECFNFGKRLALDIVHIEKQTGIDLYYNVDVINNDSHYLLWRELKYGGSMIYRFDLIPLVLDDIYDLENRLKVFEDTGIFPVNDLI